MRMSRFTEAQIIGMIKEQEAGMPTTEVCRRHRRTFATVAIEAGVLEEIVGRLLYRTPLSITGQRYRESLKNLTPADIYTGRGHETLLQRKKTKVEQ